MAKNTVIVSVLADTKQFSQAMQGSESAMGKLGGVAKVAAAAVAAVTVAVGVKAVRAASDLQQAMGGLESVFKGNTAQMTAFAKSAADSVGLAQSDYAQLATVLGSQLKNMGIAAGEVAGQTDSLIGLGADLAAQFGGSTSDAVAALSSLMRGERDPIERYGVSINEARIQAKLAEMGLADLTGEALTQAKTQATLALLYQQTADAQGAFARESMTLAGQQERLRAGTENLYAALGTALLPAATAVTAVIAKLVNTIAASDGFAAFTQTLTDASTSFQEFVAGILDGTGKLDFGALFTGLLDAAVNGITSAASWLATGGAATLVNGLISGREALFGAAFQVFPAILEALVVSIPAIVAGVVAMVTQLAAMLVTQAPVMLDGAVQLFTGMLQAIVTVLPALIDGLVAILPPLVETILGMLPDILDAAVELFTALVESLPIILPPLIEAIVDLLPKLIETILGLIPKILDAAVRLFTALVEAIPIILPLLLTAIIKLLPKLVTTIVGMIPKIIDAAVRLFTGLVEALPRVIPQLVGALISMAPQLVGAIISIVPALVGAGIDLIGGLVSGLFRAAGSVGSALIRIAGSAIDGFKRFLGIRSPSRVFAGFGENIGEGLANGLDSTTKLVAQAVDGMAGTVVDGFDATLTADSARLSLSTTQAANAAGNRYEIYVQAIAPTAEVGRAVLEAIRSYETVIAVPAS